MSFNSSASKTAFLILSLLITAYIYIRFGNVEEEYKRRRKVIFKLNLTHRVITKISTKIAVSLFVGIYSVPTFTDRRNAIRNTWMQACHKSSEAVCFFMMDAFDFNGNPISAELRLKFGKENSTHHDIMIQDSFGGVNFAYRYFMTVIWAYERYDFDFLLRSDDDMYICFNHLLHDLPFRVNEKRLIMGYQRCTPKFTEIDEGWLLVSKDLAFEFVSRFNTTLVCHKYTSVAVSLFILNMRSEFNVTWFGDKRVHFAIFAPFARENLCNNFIAIHNVYAKTILDLHQDFLKTKEKRYVVPPVKDDCPNLHEIVDYKAVPPRYVAEPRLCKEIPIWIEESMYVGGEDRKV